MNVDEQISAHLDAGEIEAACMLAAKIADPRHHLKAMQIVSHYMNKGKRMIAIENQQAKLTKFTPYVEMHGKDFVPGAALRLEFNTASTFLSGLSDELRGMLFHMHGAKTHDLASQTAELPDLRFEKMKPPFLWLQKYDGSTLTIHIGDREENAIVLSGKVKKPLSLTPMQGGTVVVGMTFHCHPSSDKEKATLYDLQRNDIRISFEPGEEVDDDEDDEEGGEE